MPQGLFMKELWEAPCLNNDFLPENRVSGLPEPARRYLCHAMPTFLNPPIAARLTMHGQIKLKSWHPFRAEQTIHLERGMNWNARVNMYGIKISGYDRIREGQGEMRWDLFGLIPFIKASGMDITRSAAARMACEMLWLPSRFLRSDVVWEETSPHQAQAAFHCAGEDVRLHMEIDREGALCKMACRRWGNPDGGRFQYHDFGAVIEKEAVFEGIRIPITIRVGWGLGAHGFTGNGEFFRCSIDSVEYRQQGP